MSEGGGVGEGEGGTEEGRVTENAGITLDSLTLIDLLCHWYCKASIYLH